MHSLDLQNARRVKNSMTTNATVPPMLPAPRQGARPHDGAHGRRPAPPEAARRRAIARGIRFGHAAVAYSSCKKLERPARAPRFDVCA